MKHTSLEELYEIFSKHKAVTTDTRTIEAGSVFFALKGENFNGNKFALQAIEKGASYAVLDEAEYCVNEKCLLVKDVLSTLQQLAKFHRQQLKIPVLGITGSNGKTTTKELINAVLSKKYNTYATKGNLNNHIGVPLTLLSIRKEHEFAVVEMGANHIGEIEMLCNIALPDYGIITNIGSAHLEGFGGPQGVIKAKSELYRHIKAAGGKLFVNADNDLLLGLSAEISRVLYGTKKADYVGEMLFANPFVELKIQEGVEVKTNLIGKYNFENILAASCIGNFFGVEAEKIKQALEAYIPSNNRSQVIKKGSNTLLLDAYNANPTSMRAAIENMLEMKAENKILVLGDMLELGADSAKEHKAIVEFISDKKFQKICFVGERFAQAAEGTSAITSNTAEGLIDWFKNNMPQNATILIKGSREKKLETLLTAFD